MSLADIIGMLPNGTTANLSDDDVATYLRKYYFTDVEAKRKQRARRRDNFYNDGGDDVLVSDIRTFFEDPHVQKLRERFVEISKYNNVTKRIVNELSTVYSRPAKRTVDSESDNATYQEIIRFTQLDSFMRSVNQALNLHGNLLISVRVRVRPDGGREPALSFVTPGSLTVVSHPFDELYPIAYVVDHSLRLVGPSDSEQDPRYIVWDDESYFKLNTNGNFIPGTKVVHGFDRAPVVFARLDPYAIELLSDTAGEDIISGHRAVWFQNVLLLKESKSVNNQTAFIGDMSRVPTGQTADSESDLILGEDVTTQTIDRGVDLAQFRDNSDHVLERLAANQGIPPSVLRHEGAASGLEIALRRIGIREKRREQELVFRTIEKQLVETMAMVFEKDMPEFAFSTDGWSVDFGEIETPLTERERLAIFKIEREIGVTNTLEFIKERNPSLDDDQALALLEDNIAVELIRNTLLRPLAITSGEIAVSESGAAVRSSPADSTVVQSDPEAGGGQEE